jgi:RimJ/RimL family protein N-acetyltransferase
MKNIKRIFDIADVKHRKPVRMDGILHQHAMKISVSQIGQFLPWLVNADKWDIKRHKSYMESCGRESFPFQTLAFIWEGQMVGMGFVRPSDYSHSAEIMYWVNSEFSSLGLGEHIARTMIDQAFRYPNNFHVVIKTDRDNVGSKTIMQKIGAEHIMSICYYTHQNVKSMMVIWVLTKPNIKKLAEIDYRYMFNPWSDGNQMVRFARPDEPDYTQVSDPSLIRPKQDKKPREFQV